MGCGLIEQKRVLMLDRRWKKRWFIAGLLALHVMVCLLSHGVRLACDGKSFEEPDWRPASGYPVYWVSASGGVWRLDPSGAFGETGSGEQGWQRIMDFRDLAVLGDSMEQLVGDLRKGATEFHIGGERYGALLAMKTGMRLPLQTRSLTLVDPRGLQNLEWLGSPLLDRSLRTVESALLWLFDHGVPFSWMLDLPVERWSWESSFVMSQDLSGTVEDLRELEAPVLLKGVGAGSAQLEAFYELLPHSVHALHDSGQALDCFYRSAEAGGGVHRAQSEPARILIAEHSDGGGTLRFEGKALWVAILLIALSTLISEDLACVGAGILVAHGSLGFVDACLGCLLGIIGGDLFVYWLGRAFGEVLIRKRPFRWFLPEKAVQMSESWFERRGILVLIASRFMPGTRVPVYFAAGVLKATWWSMIWTLTGAALLWVPVLVGISMVLGDHVMAWFERYDFWTLTGILVVFLMVFWLTHKLLPLLTYRGRRLAYSRWLRWSRWEFWPAKVVYIPVVLFILWEGIRYRCLTLFTLANPMMRCGGLVDESKVEILNELQRAGVPIAPFVHVLPEIGTEQMREVIAKAQNDWPQPFPVVLKPERGQRGRGVQVLRDEAALMAALDALREPCLAQAYVGGIEYGVFYQRLPGDVSGRISSLNRKVPIGVTGDGVSDLEYLILHDRRAICLAPRFLKEQQERLYVVPKAGEWVPLVELGSHSRGCLFLDGRDLIGEQLSAAVDVMATRIPGFFYGRFDLKAPSEEALRRGESLTVLELNLLTSEPTHMYDPRFAITEAWRALIAHWRVVFRIGAANRTMGFKPLSLFEVLKMMFLHLRS
jgi:membrane protein DedA with SNARE-associated domain/pimeloyl-ACP methyl ester carboxylesterase